MSNSIPLSLLVSWVLFFGFVNTHQRHATRFRGASQTYHLCLQISFLLGCLAGIGLMIYYFMQVAWYWPIVLFLIGSLAGGLLFGFLDSKLGQIVMSLGAFAGWPVSAIWAFFVIRGVNP